jgi:hypothetical protein
MVIMRSGGAVLMVAVTVPWLAVFTTPPGLGRLLKGPAIERAMRQALRMLGYPDDLDRMPSGVLGAFLPGASSSWRSLLGRVLRRGGGGRANSANIRPVRRLILKAAV